MRTPKTTSSFASSACGTHLVIMSDGVFEIFDLADPRDVDTVKADPGYSGGTDGKVIAKFPGADACKNAKLGTPLGCAVLGLAYGDFAGDSPKGPHPKHKGEFSDAGASADDGRYSGIGEGRFTTTRIGDKPLLRSNSAATAAAATSIRPSDSTTRTSICSTRTSCGTLSTTAGSPETSPVSFPSRTPTG